MMYFLIIDCSICGLLVKQLTQCSRHWVWSLGRGNSTAEASTADGHHENTEIPNKDQSSPVLQYYWRNKGATMILGRPLLIGVVMERRWGIWDRQDYVNEWYKLYGVIWLVEDMAKVNREG
jgi:hypothetical protein